MLTFPGMTYIAKLLVLLPLLSSACLQSELETNEKNIADRCADAARTLQNCVGTTPEDFEASCVADPSDETFALVDELVASNCGSNFDEKSDGVLSEAVFLSVCGPVVGSALLLTRFRNDGADGLNDADTKLLRKQFGNLMDEVSIYWNAKLVDAWDLGFTEVQFKFDIAAQAFGTRIFIDRAYRPGNKSQLKLLAHELTHVQQSKRAGGFFPGFAYNYCAAFYHSDFDYNNNQLEEEARSTANEFALTHL